MMIEAVRSAITRLNAEERDIIESELQTLCSNILENEIDAESRFISILFDICLFAGFYFSAMSDRVEPSGFCFEVFEKAFRMFANIILKYLLTYLQKDIKQMIAKTMLETVSIICWPLNLKKESRSSKEQKLLKTKMKSRI